MSGGDPRSQGAAAIFWWIGWIGITIGAFFASCWFWTGTIARHYGTMDKPGAPLLWVAAVFGSWMVLLVPLIIVMYHKIDKAYEDARIAREKTRAAREKAGLRLRSAQVDASVRTLPKNLSDTLRRFPTVIGGRGQLVTAILKDGRRVLNVLVVDRAELAGIYDAGTLTFKASDIERFEPADWQSAPLEAERWLRLEGAGE